jgi:predicted RNase H-like HicB family nuclease
VAIIGAALAVTAAYFHSAYHNFMDFQFTAVFRRVPEGYIGFVEELPGANTQGATLDEARANLHEAVALVLEANRTLAQKPPSAKT